MSPEMILAETKELLAVARLRGGDPGRIAFLEGEVARMTAEVARAHPPVPPAARGEGTVGHARAVRGRTAGFAVARAMFGRRS